MNTFYELGFYGFMISIALHMIAQQFLHYKYPDLYKMQKEAETSPEMVEMMKEVVRNGSFWVKPWFMIVSNLVYMTVIVSMGVKAEVNLLSWFAFAVTAIYVYSLLWNKTKWMFKK